jgi:hypothetical protein
VAGVRSPGVPIPARATRGSRARST